MLLNKTCNAYIKSLHDGQNTFGLKKYKKKNKIHKPFPGCAHGRLTLLNTSDIYDTTQAET